MKKLIGWLILGAIFTNACQIFSIFNNNESTPVPPTSTPSELVPVKPTLSARSDDFEIFKDGLIESQRPILADLSGPSFYNIAFTIQDNMYEVKGVEEVHYTNRENVPLNEIYFRLFPNVLSGEMKVSSVRVDDQPFEPVYDLQNSLMRVPLYQPLQPGDDIEIKIVFSVLVPTTIESNYGILAYFKGVLTLAHAYPMIAVYDDRGWSAEIPPNQGDPTYADASFFLVSVDAPAELVLVGSGREVDRVDNGNKQVVTFAAGPARDFYLVASKDYTVISRTIGEVTINSYAPIGMEAGAQLAIDATIRSFSYFGKKLTPYPYTEFDIISSPTYALGIEYPGVTAITDRIYDLGNSLSGTPNSIMLESTVVHEVGHQWFYNMVGNDQLNEPWLDESLSQFITWGYYANQYGSVGASGWEQSLHGRWDSASDKKMPIGMPVSAYGDGSDYSAIIYGRGAFFFEALSEKMGEQNFDLFLQDYVISNSWGIATSENLKAIAEKHCNCKLNRLFKDWVYWE